MEKIKNLEIQRLRAVAILLVLGCHYNCRYYENAAFNVFEYRLPEIFLGGWSGVDLFFVISGFLVTQSFISILQKNGINGNQSLTSEEKIAGIKESLFTFFMRRALRLFPSAWLWVIIPLSMQMLFNTSNLLDELTFQDAFKNFILVITFQYNYALVYDKVAGILAIMWSLNVEEHYYLLISVLLIAFTKLRSRFYIFFAIIFSITMWRNIQNSSIEDWRYFYLLSHFRFDSLAYGSLLALFVPLRNQSSKLISVIEERKKLILKNLASFFLIILLLAIPFCAPFLDEKLSPLNWHTGFTTLALISCGLVYMASLNRGYVLNIPFISPILEWIGERSYIIYLSHETAVVLLYELNYRYSFILEGFSKQQRYFFLLAFFLAILFVFIELTHRFVEKPFVNLAQKFGSHRQIKNFTA